MEEIIEIQNKMAEGLKAAADVLLPRVCVVCERKLYRSERHICLMCLADMPLTRFWERDHNEMADRLNQLIETADVLYSTDGQHERYVFATALFFYDGSGNYRKIPHQLKYHGNLSLGREFGRMLGYRIRDAAHLSDVDLIVPVPLHWTREWKRGYNQAEVIARQVAEILGVDIRTDILKRHRRTRTQTKVDPSKKSENVSGAFIADKARAFEGGYRHLMIVDDVFTSGSTLLNCFLALRAVFPPSVRISVATLGFVGGD